MVHWGRRSFVVTQAETHQRIHVTESNYWSVGIKSQYVKHTLRFLTLSCLLSLTPRGIMISSQQKREVVNGQCCESNTTNIKY